MNNIKKILNKYAWVPYRYTFKKGITIVDTNNGLFVFKKRERDIEELYSYLKTCNFDYFPPLIAQEEGYNIYEYIEGLEIPNQQKAVDMIYIVSMLHAKTSFYKETNIDEYQRTYESIINQLEYLYNYYTDLITVIERNVYMSPSEYLVARNISKIYMSIFFCRKELDEWYQLVKQKSKKRLVITHNNIDIDHFIINEKGYLLSWEKAIINSPIYDIYYFYKKRALELDFKELFEIYEKNFPLLEEERKFLFILLSIPDKIEFNKTEFENCQRIGKIIDYIYKTEILLNPYYSIKEIE